MTNQRATKFSELIENVAQQIVATVHDHKGSFIRTPLLYPGGATVVVRIEPGDNKYLVSDWGLGYQEADLVGASLLYPRHARAIAENAGVRFDNQAFFILEATRDQLAGAVVTIANCSQEATMRAADALAEKTFEDSKERLYERLVAVFKKPAVSKNAQIVGSSSTKWSVAAFVRISHGERGSIFEPVTKHHSSVAHAAMKFHDIALLENAPRRIAVVNKKVDFGTYLGVLSQSANVVDEDISNEALIQLSKAA
jgi:hypothetical protein